MDRVSSNTDTQTPVTLTWDNGQGFTFKRTLSIDDKYLFTVKDEVDNKSAAPPSSSLTPASIATAYQRVEGWAILHEGPIGFLSPDDKNGLKELPYADLKKDAETASRIRKSRSAKRRSPTVNGGWFGFTDKYWAATLIPDQAPTYDAHIIALRQDSDQEEGFQTDYIEPAQTIAAGALDRRPRRTCSPVPRKSHAIDGYREPRASSASTSSSTGACSGSSPSRCSG